MNSKIRKSLFTYQVSIVNRILVDSVMHFIQYTGLLFASDFLGLHFIKFIRIFRLRIKSLFSRKFDLKCSCPEFCMGDQKLIHLYKDFSFFEKFYLLSRVGQKDKSFGSMLLLGTISNNFYYSSRTVFE